MSWKQGRFARFRFCPECGTMTLRRENKGGDDYGKPQYGCHLCGISFRVIPSELYILACRLARQERKIREPNT